MKLIEIKKFLVFSIIFIGIAVFQKTAQGMPGTHGIAVSTWNTTRSTVVFSYNHGILLGGGYLNQASYHANFTSTTGRLSAQFGLQFLNLKPDALENATYGAAASATALYAFPIGPRYANGVPKAAFNIYAGSVPSLLISGKYNYMTIPINMGLGITVNPVRFLSITPWVELTPSFNVDTFIDPMNFEAYIETLTEDDIGIVYGPDGRIVDVIIDESRVNSVVSGIVDSTVDLDLFMAFRMRFGLSIALNMGDRVSLQLNGAIVQMGKDFDAKPAVFLGTALNFAWDNPPDRILPSTQRMKGISCEDLAAEFQRCGDYLPVADKEPAIKEKPQITKEAPKASKEKTDKEKKVQAIPSLHAPLVEKEDSVKKETATVKEKPETPKEKPEAPKEQKPKSKTLDKLPSLTDSF